MMIYLMQHGEAVTSSTEPERPLSADGRKQIVASANAVKALGIRPHAIICSSKLRSRQTAEIIADAVAFPASDIAETDTIKPTAPVEDALGYLGSLDAESVFIAGHLPSLAGIAAALLTPGSDVFIQIENGGLICIDAPAVPPSDLGGTLCCCLPPSALRLIS